MDPLLPNDFYCQSFDKAVEDILMICSQFVGAKTFFIGEIQEGSFTILKVKNRHGIDIVDGLVVPLTETPRSFFSLEEKPVLAKDHDAYIQINQNSENPYQISSYLSVPVFRQDGTFFGVLCAVDLEPYPFSEEEVSLLTRLAGFLSLAIDYRTKDIIDSLTGIHNRNFLDHLTTHWELPEEGLCLMYLDVDRFKLINDTLGHLMGDKLLFSIVTRLKEGLQKNDYMIRIGGDEFLLVLPSITKADEAEAYAQQIIDLFAQPFWISDYEIFLSLSIGISLSPQDGADLRSLVKNSDIAMYRAKEKGRNNYQLFSFQMKLTDLEQLILKNSLHKAVKNNEFMLLYQPRIHLKTGEVIGAEALIRWNHPDLGLIPPVKFIPLAEETGLILPVGEWVLRTACKQNKEWQRKGYPPIRVSVNLSPRQFTQKNLVQMLAQILKETKLDPKYLELEITESISIEDMETVISILHDLKALGVKIAIDDFGTGHSSLSYLKRFPVHCLKIDQSFIRNIAAKQGDLAITKAIITMAHGLDLNIVAEGIETIEQLSILKLYQCDEAQGYYFSKPITIADMESRFQSVLLAKGT